MFPTTATCICLAKAGLPFAIYGFRRVQISDVTVAYRYREALQLILQNCTTTYISCIIVFTVKHDYLTIGGRRRTYLGPLAGLLCLGTLNNYHIPTGAT